MIYNHIHINILDLNLVNIRYETNFVGSYNPPTIRKFCPQNSFCQLMGFVHAHSTPPSNTVLRRL